MKTIKKIFAALRNEILTGAALTLGFLCGTGVASADSGFETVNVNPGGASVNGTMNKVVGFILTIFRWVGVVLFIFGIYEIVMSFMQNQPEAKTRGVIMIIAGIIMMAMKTVLAQLGVIS